MGLSPASARLPGGCHGSCACMLASRDVCEGAVVAEDKPLRAGLRGGSAALGGGLHEQRRGA